MSTEEKHQSAAELIIEAQKGSLEQKVGESRKSRWERIKERLVQAYFTGATLGSIALGYLAYDCHHPQYNDYSDVGLGIATTVLSIGIFVGLPHRMMETSKEPPQTGKGGYYHHGSSFPSSSYYGSDGGLPNE